MPDSDTTVSDRAMVMAETALYVLIAFVLVAGAFILLATVVYRLVVTLDDGVDPAVQETLGTLLLAFIFVELLGATRATIRERKLVAEPFLLVGIIALIKDLVLLTGTDKALEPGTETFRDAMIEVGAFGVLVLVLVVATLLVRRRQREPEEVHEGQA